MLTSSKGFIKKENIDFINKYIIGKYKINTLEGEIYSHRTQKPMGTFHKQTKYSYASITYEKGKTKLVPIHWIIGVAEGILKENQRVEHLDGDKTNNKIQNLRIIKKFDYKIKGDVAEIYIDDFNQIVLIDTDSLALVSKYLWRVDKDGYIVTNIGKNKTSTKMHRFITKCPDDKEVDHKNRIRHDNRKTNLRICERQQNSFNISVPSNNTSGIIGVYYDKSKEKWCGRLNKSENSFFKRFDNKEDAIKYRLELESIHFGEFSPQKHLFEDYDL